MNEIIRRPVEIKPKSGELVSHVPERLFGFTIEELKTLYKLLEFQYIPHSIVGGHDVVNKIIKIIKEYDNNSGMAG